MKPINMIFIFVALLANVMLGQNRELIPNGNFEAHKKVRNISNSYTVSETAVTFSQLKFWTKIIGTKKYASPDYYFMDKKRRKKNLGRIYTDYASITPFDNGVSGIMVFTSQNAASLNYREFLCVPFISRLEIGATYEVSFYISNGSPNDAKSYGSYAVKNLGLLFTEKKPIVNKGEFSLIPAQKPQKIIEEYIHEIGWKKITITYEADKAYRYLTVGYFTPTTLDDFAPLSNDDTSEVKDIKQSYAKGNHCYYFFDNFSMKKISNPEEKKSEHLAQLEKELSKSREELCGSKLKLPSLNFDKARTTFNKKNKKKAYQELDLIASYLESHPSSRIEIGGHTEYFPEDSVDYITHQIMNTLSRKRANTAKRYLTQQKGINPIRISTVGYGFTKPVIKKEDIPINRRIEIGIICSLDSVFTNLQDTINLKSQADTISILFSLDDKSEKPVLDLRIKLDSVIEVAPKDTSYVFGIGQKFKFNYSKDAYRLPILSSRFRKAPIHKISKIAEVKQSKYIVTCKNGIAKIADWYKIRFEENNEVKEVWVLGLYFINPETICR